MKTKNKLQHLIDAIKPLYNLNCVYRFVSNKLGKTDCGEEGSCECEKNGLYWTDKYLKFMWGLELIIKKIFNQADFKRLDDIIEYLKNDIAPEQIFSKEKTIFLEKDNQYQIFIVFSNIEVFVVTDNGYELSIIFRKNKVDFKYSIIKHNNKFRLYIEDTITTLPININYSGTTETISLRMNKFIKE